jgi:hypothetical protein
MTSNYLKFLLTVSFCLNLFLGYYLIYNFFIKKQEINNDYIIKEKELKIEELDKINKEKELVIDSLENVIVKTEKNSLTLKEKIKENKKDEKVVKTRRVRINNSDDAALLSELSAEEFEY